MVPKPSASLRTSWSLMLSVALVTLLIGEPTSMLRLVVVGRSQSVPVPTMDSSPPWKSISSPCSTMSPPPCTTTPPLKITWLAPWITSLPEVSTTSL